MTSKVGLLSGGQRQAVTLLMATLKKPKLLLLDEHTAALDPKTAAKVLELSDKIVHEHNLTTLMITHNMRDAIKYGNRLIMMHEGRVIYDVCGEEKSKLQVSDLLLRFEQSILISMLPKSVTTAIGVSLSELFGGMAGVTTAAIIVTGIGGNMMGVMLCKLFGITDEVALGVAFGTSAHVIGTAKANELSELTGAASSLSLVVAGLLTAVFMPVIARVL